MLEFINTNLSSKLAPLLGLIYSTNMHKMEKILGDVTLNFHEDAKQDFHAYGWGFQRAADSLGKKFLANKMQVDTDACPIVFLYRHSVELYLKHLILHGSKCISHAQKQQINFDEVLNDIRTHFIDELFRKARIILIALEMWDENEPYAKEIFSTMTYLSNLDNSSLIFRYPTNQKGEPYLRKNFKICLKDFIDKASKLCTSLDGCCMFMYEVEEHLTIEHDYYEEMLRDIEWQHCNEWY